MKRKKLAKKVVNPVSPELLRSLALNTSRLYVKPACGCPSLYSHLPTCRLIHPDIAKLPMKLPEGVRVCVSPSGYYVNLTLCRALAMAKRGSGEVIRAMKPDEARAVARMLLLIAYAAQRAES